MAAAVALDLIQRDEAREQWLMPSVLPKMSVGALACHLGRQVVRAVELLPMATDVPPLACADAHYHRAAGVRSASPDDPSNDRSTDDAEAKFGAAALAGRAAEALEMVRRLLAAGTARDVVPVPWQGWSLRRDVSCPAFSGLANLRLSYAAAVISRYSSMTSCGVRYPSAE
jgi:hypothetical protein